MQLGCWYGKVPDHSGFHWLETSHTKDIILLEETAILADNLSGDMSQVSVHAMIENESYDHTTGLFDVYLNYVIHIANVLLSNSGV